METQSQGGLIFPDRPREECGIFAVYGHPEAAKLTYFGLYALQHRGQESAGIVSSDGKCVMEYKAMGLVPDIFGELWPKMHFQVDNKFYFYFMYLF